MAIVETLNAWLLFKNTIRLWSQDQVFMGAAIFQHPVTYGYSCDICLTHSCVNEKSFVPCVMVGNQPGKSTSKEPSFRISVHTYAPSEPLLGQTYTKTEISNSESLGIFQDLCAVSLLGYPVIPKARNETQFSPLY